jgi:hypothetical protein
MPIAPLDAMKNLGAGEKMMTDDRATVSDYLVLGTWEAITLLGQAGELCSAGEISDMIARAEAILISVVSELPRALADPAAPTRFDRSLPSLGGRSGVSSTIRTWETQSQPQTGEEFVNASF